MVVEVHERKNVKGRIAANRPKSGDARRLAHPLNPRHPAVAASAVEYQAAVSVPAA